MRRCVVAPLAGPGAETLARPSARPLHRKHARPLPAIGGIFKILNLLRAGAARARTQIGAAAARRPAPHSSAAENVTWAQGGRALA